MTYHTQQNLLLGGSLLLLALILLSPLLERSGPVGRVPLPQTQTVSAATTVRVWVHKKTGLYYCPDSRAYGKFKPGAYMTQEKALESAYRPAAQEPCQ